MIGIVATVFNRKEAVEASLNAIVTTLPDNVPIVIINDDSSEAGMSDMLRGRFTGRCTLITNARNRGLCHCSNVGFEEIRKAGAVHMLRINTDVIVRPGWYEALCGAMDDPAVGVAGPLYESFGTSGFWPNQDSKQKLPYRYKTVPCVVGHCFVISGTLWDAGFRFDEGMYPVGPCDVDVCCFSRSRKMRAVVARDSVVTILPVGKSTENHAAFVYQRCFPDYQKKLAARYGPKVYDPVISHQYKLYNG